MLKKLIMAAIALGFVCATNAFGMDDTYCWDYNHREATSQHGYISRYPGADVNVDEWVFWNRTPGQNPGLTLEEGNRVNGDGWIYTSKIKFGHCFQLEALKDGWWHPGTEAQEWVYIPDPGGDHSKCRPTYRWNFPQTFSSTAIIPGTSQVTVKRQNGTPVANAPVEAAVVGTDNDVFGMHRAVNTDSNGVGKLSPLGVSFGGTSRYQQMIWQGGYRFKSKVIDNEGTVTDTITIPNDTKFKVRRMGRPIANSASGLFDPSTLQQLNQYNELTDSKGEVVYNTDANSMLFAVNIENGTRVYGPFPKYQENTVVSYVPDRPELYEPQDYYAYNQNDMMFIWEDLSATPLHLDYELNIANDGELIFSMPFSQNGVVITGFPAGIFEWQVWAFDREDYAYAMSPVFLFGCRVSRDGETSTKSDKVLTLESSDTEAIQKAKDAGYTVVDFNDFKVDASRAKKAKMRKDAKLLDISVEPLREMDVSKMGNAVVFGATEHRETIKRSELLKGVLGND